VPTFYDLFWYIAHELWWWSVVTLQGNQRPIAIPQLFLLLPNILIHYYYNDQSKLDRMLGKKTTAASQRQPPPTHHHAVSYSRRLFSSALSKVYHKISLSFSAAENWPSFLSFIVSSLHYFNGYSIKSHRGTKKQPKSHKISWDYHHPPNNYYFSDAYPVGKGEVRIFALESEQFWLKCGLGWCIISFIQENV
jgi:hypothetical protein